MSHRVWFRGCLGLTFLALGCGADASTGTSIGVEAAALSVRASGDGTRIEIRRDHSLVRTLQTERVDAGFVTTFLELRDSRHALELAEGAWYEIDPGVGVHDTFALTIARCATTNSPLTSSSDASLWRDFSFACEPSEGARMVWFDAPVPDGALPMHFQVLATNDTIKGQVLLPSALLAPK